MINYQTLKHIAMFLLVIALGMTAVNQTLGFLYKAEFLKQPCALCAELNPDVKECVYKNKATYFLSGQEWIDPFETNQIKINLTELNLNP